MSMFQSKNKCTVIYTSKYFQLIFAKMCDIEALFFIEMSCAESIFLSAKFDHHKNDNII